ncbi:unnamed protein product [Menidia menidia]|uniref:Cysteine-rich protein 1 n=1 Tax=Menidia menidia TaxID=238744 RepID=A0A8S4AI53_9TELE|nr:unnamed protein product [Menidia menidia]
MPKCPKCQKEVYFAERVTSLGKDWHRPCLKCEKCNKTLSAGSHAEGSHTVTTPAMLLCLDLKDLDAVELRATPTNKQDIPPQ